MTPTWNDSVSKARAGNLRAIEGRFAAALASFEQIHPDGSVRAQTETERVAMEEARRDHRKFATRTLLDFAEEVGMPYATLAKYRSVTYWWYESDLGLVDEIGPPESIAWQALLWAKHSAILSADVRKLMRKRAPTNGHIWTVDDVERALRSKTPRPSANPYDPVRGIRTARTRLTQTLLAITRGGRLNDEDKRIVRMEAESARAAADFLLSALDGRDEEAVREWLQAQAPR